MQIKVKTLTGKEIEIDIEVSDKIERIKGQHKVFIDQSECWKFKILKNKKFQNGLKKKKVSHQLNSALSLVVNS